MLFRSWTVPTGVTSIQYLVVGGGGGGTEGAGGHGGGGGEVVTSPAYSVTPGTTMTITVGGGGAGNDPRTPGGYSPAPSWFAGNGTNSSFGTAPSQVVARYGEGAQGDGTYNGPRGVSRGGASGAGWTTPTYLGGTGYLANYNEKGGGGGGAGGAGQNYGVFNPNYAGNGGVGIASSLSGSALYYGGGGAGGGTVPYPGGGAYAGYGGLGGGGRMDPIPAYSSPNGTAFYGYIANGGAGTGGGGGGGNAYVGSGSGGGGVVILKWT